MAKKNWTDEERKAFGDKMRAARAQKQKEVVNTEDVVAVAEQSQGEVVNLPDGTDLGDGHPTVVEQPTIVTEMTTEEILKKAVEAIGLLAQMQTNGGAVNNDAQVSNQGKLVGTTIKYSIDPAKYPDPTERLADEERLKRFAFKDNYELQYSVSTSEYTTVDHIRMKEPKFTLKLIRVVYDEDTGEKTDLRYLVHQQILCEDPDSALIVARQNGIDVDSFDEDAFLNEMRYIIMRDWLFEVFYPKKQDKKEQITDLVVDGKIVPSWTISSEKPTRIKFDELDGKL